MQKKPLDQIFIRDVFNQVNQTRKAQNRPLLPSKYFYDQFKDNPDLVWDQLHISCMADQLRQDYVRGIHQSAVLENMTEVKQSITALTHEEKFDDFTGLKDKVHTLSEYNTQLEIDTCLSQNGWWSAHAMAALVERESKALAKASGKKNKPRSQEETLRIKEELACCQILYAHLQAYTKKTQVFLRDRTFHPKLGSELEIDETRDDHSLLHQEKSLAAMQSCLSQLVGTHADQATVFNRARIQKLLADFPNLLSDLDRLVEACAYQPASLRDSLLLKNKKQNDEAWMARYRHLKTFLLAVRDDTTDGICLPVHEWQDFLDSLINRTVFTWDELAVSKTLTVKQKQILSRWVKKHEHWVTKSEHQRRFQEQRIHGILGSSKQLNARYDSLLAAQAYDQTLQIYIKTHTEIFFNILSFFTVIKQSLLRAWTGQDNQDVWQAMDTSMAANLTCHQEEMGKICDAMLYQLKAAQKGRTASDACQRSLRQLGFHSFSYPEHLSSQIKLQTKPQIDFYAYYQSVTHYLKETKQDNSKMKKALLGLDWFKPLPELEKLHLTASQQDTLIKTQIFYSFNQLKRFDQIKLMCLEVNAQGLLVYADTHPGVPRQYQMVMDLIHDAKQTLIQLNEVAKKASYRNKAQYRRCCILLSSQLEACEKDLCLWPLTRKLLPAALARVDSFFRSRHQSLEMNTSNEWASLKQGLEHFQALCQAADTQVPFSEYPNNLEKDRPDLKLRSHALCELAKISCVNNQPLPVSAEIEFLFQSPTQQAVFELVSKLSNNQLLTDAEHGLLAGYLSQDKDSLFPFDQAWVSKMVNSRVFKQFKRVEFHPAVLRSVYTLGMMKDEHMLNIQKAWEHTLSKLTQRLINHIDKPVDELCLLMNAYAWVQTDPSLKSEAWHTCQEAMKTYVQAKPPFNSDYWQLVLTFGDETSIASLWEHFFTCYIQFRHLPSQDISCEQDRLIERFKRDHADLIQIHLMTSEETWRQSILRLWETNNTVLGEHQAYRYLSLMPFESRKNLHEDMAQLFVFNDACCQEKIMAYSHLLDKHEQADFQKLIHRKKDSFLLTKDQIPAIFSIDSDLNWVLLQERYGDQLTVYALFDQWIISLSQDPANQMVKSRAAVLKKIQQSVVLEDAFAQRLEEALSAWDDQVQSDRVKQIAEKCLTSKTISTTMIPLMEEDVCLFLDHFLQKISQHMWASLGKSHTHGHELLRNRFCLVTEQLKCQFPEKGSWIEQKQKTSLDFLNEAVEAFRHEEELAKQNKPSKKKLIKDGLHKTVGFFSDKAHKAGGKLKCLSQKKIIEKILTREESKVECVNPDDEGRVAYW